MQAPHQLQVSQGLPGWLLRCSSTVPPVDWSERPRSAWLWAAPAPRGLWPTSSGSSDPESKVATGMDPWKIKKIKTQHGSEVRLGTRGFLLELYHNVTILILSNLNQYNQTEAGRKKSLDPFFGVTWILAYITVIGYREHDQDSGSMIKVYNVRGWGIGRGAAWMGKACHILN